MKKQDAKKKAPKRRKPLPKPKAPKEVVMWYRLTMPSQEQQDRTDATLQLMQERMSPEERAEEGRLFAEMKLLETRRDHAGASEVASRWEPLADAARRRVTPAEIEGRALAIAAARSSLP